MIEKRKKITTRVVRGPYGDFLEGNIDQVIEYLQEVRKRYPDGTIEMDISGKGEYSIEVDLYQTRVETDKITYQRLKKKYGD